MASTINGTSTGSGGLISSGDDSGILNIQTNETTAMSIDASQSVDFTNNIDAPNTFGFKNRVINGNATIDQRNAGASITPASGTDNFPVDRFSIYPTQASKLTAQQNQNSVTPPAGFKNYIGITSSSAYSVVASDLFGLFQNIEGFNTADLGWGAAGASTVTLSFWVRSSLTGTFGGAVLNSAQDRSYPFSFTINSANTWEYETITIPGDTTGTWLTTTGRGISICWSLGMGSSRVGAVNTWAATGNFAPTGATNLVGTNGATLYITGVQLEKGTQATSFDFRDYGRELALCQRYFQKTYPQASVPGNTSGSQSGAMFSTVPASTNYPNIGLWSFPVTMRTAPTVVAYNPTTGSTTSFIGDGVSYTPSGTSAVGERGVAFFGSNVVVGTNVFVSVHATASAEL
jgi:hypothetical protein